MRLEERCNKCCGLLLVQIRIKVSLSKGRSFSATACEGPTDPFTVGVSIFLSSLPPFRALRSHSLCFIPLSASNISSPTSPDSLRKRTELQKWLSRYTARADESSAFFHTWKFDAFSPADCPSRPLTISELVGLMVRDKRSLSGYLNKDGHEVRHAICICV